MFQKSGGDGMLLLFAKHEVHQVIDNLGLHFMVQ